MKIAVLQENLSKGLSVVSRSVSTKATLPILSNILMATDNGSLKLSATNLETGINFWIGAKIEEEGAITIPAKFLTEFIASLPNEKIEIEVKENIFYAQCGSYKANIAGMAASEFPQIPTPSEESMLVFNKEDFVGAVNQVFFAAATDEGRPTLTGVLIKPEDGQVSFVATDGYRLSVKKVKAESKAMEKLIIPAKTLLEVSRIVQEKGSEAKEIKLSLAKGQSQIVFSFPEVEIASRLIEGEFPNFEKIIPETHDIQISLDREEFLKAVKICSIFAREQANIVKIKTIDGKLKISAESSQIGASEIEVEAKVEGGETEMAFNFRFLLDFLNATSGQEEVMIEATGPLNPGNFKISSDNSFFHIIMPVRIQA